MSEFQHKEKCEEKKKDIYTDVGGRNVLQSHCSSLVLTVMLGAVSEAPVTGTGGERQWWNGDTQAPHQQTLFHMQEALLRGTGVSKTRHIWSV